MSTHDLVDLPPHLQAQYDEEAYMNAREQNCDPRMNAREQNCDPRMYAHEQNCDPRMYAHEQNCDPRMYAHEQNCDPRMDAEMDDPHMDAEMDDPHMDAEMDDPHMDADATITLHITNGNGKNNKSDKWTLVQKNGGKTSKGQNTWADTVKRYHASDIETANKLKKELENDKIVVRDLKWLHCGSLKEYNNYYGTTRSKLPRKWPTAPLVDFLKNKVIHLDQTSALYKMINKILHSVEPNNFTARKSNTKDEGAKNIGVHGVHDHHSSHPVLGPFYNPDNTEAMEKWAVVDQRAKEMQRLARQDQRNRTTHDRIMQEDAIKREMFLQHKREHNRAYPSNVANFIYKPHSQVPSVLGAARYRDDSRYLYD
jgi:hypothetical protein